MPFERVEAVEEADLVVAAVEEVTNLDNGGQRWVRGLMAPERAKARMALERSPTATRGGAGSGRGLRKALRKKKEEKIGAIVTRCKDRLPGKSGW